MSPQTVRQQKTDTETALCHNTSRITTREEMIVPSISIVKSKADAMFKNDSFTEQQLRDFDPKRFYKIEGGNVAIYGKDDKRYRYEKITYLSERQQIIMEAAGFNVNDKTSQREGLKMCYDAAVNGDSKGAKALIALQRILRPHGGCIACPLTAEYGHDTGGDRWCNKVVMPSLPPAKPVEPEPQKPTTPTETFTHTPVTTTPMTPRQYTGVPLTAAPITNPLPQDQPFTPECPTPDSSSLTNNQRLRIPQKSGGGSTFAIPFGGGVANGIVGKVCPPPFCPPGPKGGGIRL